MQLQSTSLGRAHGVRVEPGEDILETLQAAVVELGVRDALILGGVGSVASYRYHVVGTSELPPENAFLQGKEPLDVLNLSGMIFDGRVHAHISFCGQKGAFGGHLELGCRVLTFCSIWLAELPDVDVAAWDSVATG